MEDILTVSVNGSVTSTTVDKSELPTPADDLPTEARPETITELVRLYREAGAARHAASVAENRWSLREDQLANLIRSFLKRHGLDTETLYTLVGSDREPLPF